MSQIIALNLIALGVCLLLLGLALSGVSFSSPGLWAALVSSVSLAGATDWARRAAKEWRGSLRLWRSRKRESPLAADLTPCLFGDYTPGVVEAAEALGKQKDITAVPALVRALEQCVNYQRPGWRDRAEALADSLAAIGDSRALELLYRLENVRGIGLIPAIRRAITCIEPQSSLLRPSGSRALPPETLLRPVKDYNAEIETTVLVRAVERHER